MHPNFSNILHTKFDEMIRISHCSLFFTMIIGLWVLLSACHQVSPETDVLCLADSLSEHNPKEAVRLIDSIGQKIDHTDKATEAYYQLIRTKVYDRAYIRHTQDSTIKKVIDYYENHPEGNLLAWAYCYGGRVYRDLNDAPRALAYFQRSLDALEQNDDATLKTRVLSQIGYIYYSQNLFAKARDIKRQVLALDSIAGNHDRMAVGYKDLAQCSFALREIERARNYVSQALSLIDAFGLERRRADVVLLDARIALDQGRNSVALSAIKPYLNDSTILNPVPFYMVGGEVYMALQRYDDAKHMCQNILKDGHNIQACYKASRMMTEICRQHKQPDSMAYYQECSVRLLDSIAASDQHEEIRSVSELYNYQLRERENELLQAQVRQSRLWLVVALLSAFLLLLLLGVVLLRYSHKRLESKLQHIRIKHLQEEIALRSKSIEELTEQLMQNQTKAEDFELQFRSSELNAKIKARLNSQSILSATEWTEIEQYFDEHLPQFLPRLRQLYDFSEVEWRLSLLVRLSFRNIEIATLLCKHPSSITYAKKRLCAKVLDIEPSAEKWEELVRNI